MRHRRVLLPLVLLLLLLAAAVTGYWFWWAAQIEAGLARWADEQRARGYDLAYEAPQIDGFPLSHVLRIEAARLRAPQGWRWQGPPLGARASLWAPRTIALSFSGHHLLEGLTGAPFDAATFDADLAEGDIRIGADGRLAAAEAKLRQARIMADPPGRFSAERLDLQILPDYASDDGGPPVGFRFTGTAGGLTLPPDLAQPFDATAEHISVAGRLVGVPPNGAPRRALALWRDAGGRLELDRVEITWPPLALTASGELRLDAELRPEGTLSAKVAGLPELTGRMSALGLLAGQQAAVTQAAIVAFSGQPDADGRAWVTLPITLRGGFLYLGPIQLAPLAPLL